MSKLIFGIDEGLGNIIQCEPAIAALRREGLKVFATKTGNWPRIWEVLEGRVDGFVDVSGIRQDDHFIKSAQWRRGKPDCMNFSLPYSPINEVELNFLCANYYCRKMHNKNLRSGGPARLVPQWDGSGDLKNKKYLAINPAKSLVPRAWNAKLYKHWEKMIGHLAIYFDIAIVGTSHDVLKDFSFAAHGVKDNRMDGKSPLDHANFLTEECYALLTTEGGFGFLGVACGVQTFIMWGPNRLYRNAPIGIRRPKILFNGDCQECLIVDEWNSRFPPCPYKNNCLEFTPEKIAHELRMFFDLDYATKEIKK